MAVAPGNLDGMVADLLDIPNFIIVGRLNKEQRPVEAAHSAMPAPARCAGTVFSEAKQRIDGLVPIGPLYFKFLIAVTHFNTGRLIFGNHSKNGLFFIY
jgi:hypothetical protein